AFAELLEQEGYEVFTAMNGDAGLRQMRALRPDVVVLDLVMPHTNGWQFRLEQKHDPVLAETPGVAISASCRAAAATDASDVSLRKPFRPAELLSAIDGVLRANERRRVAITTAQQER